MPGDSTNDDGSIWQRLEQEDREAARQSRRAVPAFITMMIALVIVFPLTRELGFNLAQQLVTAVAVGFVAEGPLWLRRRV